MLVIEIACVTAMMTKDYRYVCGICDMAPGKPAQLVCEALTAVGNKFPDSLQGSASSYLALLQKWTIEGLPSDHVQVRACT